MSLRSPRRPIRRGLPHLVDFGWRERLRDAHRDVCSAWEGELRPEVSLRNFPGGTFLFSRRGLCEPRERIVSNDVGHATRHS